MIAAPTSRTACRRSNRSERSNPYVSPETTIAAALNRSAEYASGWNPCVTA
jgi:hypothetical protein